MSLTADQLPPLLDILDNPENPAFEQALARLSDLDASTLSPESAPALLARIQATITRLMESQRLTTQQLNALRRGNSALQSYTQNL